MPLRLYEPPSPWSAIQDAAERRFGHRSARLYPFLRLDPLRDPATPLVRMPDGPGRLLSVGIHGALIILEVDLVAHQEAIKAGRRQRVVMSGPPARRYLLKTVLPPELAALLDAREVLPCRSLIG